MRVSIGNSVDYIGYHAFHGCTRLTDVSISGSVVEIGNNAFQGCTALSEITIPSSVKKIGLYAFNGCTNLKSIIFEDAVGWYADSKQVPEADLSSPNAAASALTSKYYYNILTKA